MRPGPAISSPKSRSACHGQQPAADSHSASGYVQAVSPAYLSQELTRPLSTKDGGTLRTVVEARAYIVQDVPDFVSRLRDAAGRLYAPAIVALFTGMRLGEVLALRERSVDLDKGVIEVREALEETGAHGIRFKSLKTRAGRRNITLPDIVVGVLREHRKQLLERRLMLGQGKLAPDDLLFGNLEGGPLRTSAMSSDWGDVAERLGVPEITFHGLRHTHASQLIDAGVDIVTISKRLGHANPKITLAIYAHMFRTDDSKAAAAINAALR
jgi:integrase